MRLEIKNATFGYRKGTELLRNLSFCVETGQIVAVLGPNGAGKTTLLRAMLGLLKWQAGESLLDGRNIKTISDKVLFRHLAYVPQARAGASALSVLQSVLLGRSGQLGVFSAPTDGDVTLVLQILQSLGIVQLKDKRCFELSGGEQQMVHIARALAQQPRLLILDEPESNLDFKNQLLVLDTITSLRAKGLGCLFNTHYPAHALQRADKALLLFRDGSYLFDDARAVVTEEHIEQAFGVRAMIWRKETENGQVTSIVPLSAISENLGE